MTSSSKFINETGGQSVIVTHQRPTYCLGLSGCPEHRRLSPERAVDTGSCRVSSRTHPLSFLLLYHISLHISTYLLRLLSLSHLHPLPILPQSALAHGALGAGQPTAFLVSCFQGKVRYTRTAYFPLLWTTWVFLRIIMNFRVRVRKRLAFSRFCRSSWFLENPVYVKFHLLHMFLGKKCFKMTLYVFNMY